MPSGDPLLESWSKATDVSGLGMGTIPVYAGRGVLQAVLSVVRSRRLTHLLDGVRADTLSELLDQADTLNRHGYHAAATVVAGGALETHLRYLCVRGNCVPDGASSIEKYRANLDQERKAGREIISTGDGKQVTAWGDRRNDAAHDPANFTDSKEKVSLMIEGIRQFISRTE